MRLDYNLLWIDNDLPGYEERGEVDGLSSYISELGFRPQIKTLLGEDGLEQALAESRFDLIVSDYNLDSTDGVAVVQSIRDSDNQTEILFYTARVGTTTSEELREKLKNIDRISIHLGRDTLIAKIESTIDLTVERLIELTATRGLITSETSELDVVIQEIVLHLTNDRLKVSEEDKTKMLETNVCEVLEKRKEDFRKKMNEESFDDCFASVSVEAYRKWTIFRELLKQLDGVEKSEELKLILEINKTYGDQVITIRNKFAHAKAITENGQTRLKGQLGKEDFNFDQDKCIDIRKNLIVHRDNFDSLRKYLGMES